MIRYGLIAAALMLPGIAHAQDWRLASQEEGNRSVMFVDAETVTAPQAVSRGMALLILSQPDRGIIAIQTELAFECATGRRQIINMRAYSQQLQPGELLDGDGTWEDTPKDTQ